MYEATTKSIRVRVVPQFLDDRSDAEEGRFVWAYSIDLVNEGNETVQLKSRYWRITDAQGKVEEVRGPGVVGETPVLVPGASFSYTSICPLATPSGIMIGKFFMVTDRGQPFAVDVPPFSLDSPYEHHAVN